jgi:adenosylcobinamide-GDP ribazoletransferase
MPPFLRGARAAFVFLTRVPLGGFPYAEADWRWASGWFPLVGLALGAAEAVVFVATRRAGPWAAAALAVVAGLLLTGAFHEDGLADTADALGGAYDRENLFRILKDSRVGSFGAAALAMALLLRVALLARLDGGAPAALAAAQCLSRAPPVWLMAALPYVTADEAARSRLLARAGAPQAALAAALAALAAAALWRAGALRGAELPALALAAAVTPVVCGRRFVARAGGITGDFLGATQQVGECALLLALALARGGD